MTGIPDTDVDLFTDEALSDPPEHTQAAVMALAERACALILGRQPAQAIAEPGELASA
jgi:hypothetical protein